MEEAGYSVKLFVPQVKDGISLMKEELEKTKYDLVIIGVSCTLQPPFCTQAY